ncbi:DUF4168 domain-containing protein [Thioalkalicoccus limnaeus]|uniref:DUF4168 domain-containing protein n=1 Tax=Thioalkalicoccus limnaeus TaxID=120681 RepID=A0ABV4BEQ5_9GAMM
MAKKFTARLLVLSAALCVSGIASATTPSALPYHEGIGWAPKALPGKAPESGLGSGVPGQFPYTAWSCSGQWCSPAVLPATSDELTWTRVPHVRAYTPGAPAEVQFESETLDRFVTAFGKVKEITGDFATKLQAAKTEQQAQELREAAQAETMAALEAAEITLDEYNDVASAMDRDTDLRMRLFARLN